MSQLGSISYDDATRTVTIFDANGGVVETRAYTTPENAAADAAVVTITAQTNGATLRADVRAQIDTLKALIGSSTDPAGTNSLRAIKATTNATINAGPAPYIKADNQALIDVAQALVRISRLIVGALDDPSSAPAAAPQ